ncbi:hypothetical protein BpHYR1_018459 [Brachionus plicatilis]|uniref:Uncharacterized protein n=1 Tax=Brachionus plicatilis TaxID=10195 RepID=A0A3M7QDN7_BRAPC|nr:hypothetical protein BpHYR1_018459 [Brachionus plicatilis]
MPTELCQCCILITSHKTHQAYAQLQLLIGADQKDNDDNMIPKMPGYQPRNFNDVISQISTQDLKTPVLEVLNQIKRFSESDPMKKSSQKKNQRNH